jgi:hypothetical protein
MGKRKYIIQCLEHYLDSSKYDQNRWLTETVQGVWSLVYLNNAKNPNSSVLLDQEGKYFVSLFLLNNGKDYTLNEDKQLTFLETKEVPYFVHFNGDAKNQMPEFNIKYYLR